MLTLDKFEEASEKVKEVTLETKLIYSNYLSEQTGNKVYLKPENMQFTGAYKVRGAYYKISTLLSSIALFILSDTSSVFFSSFKIFPLITLTISPSFTPSGILSLPTFIIF